jgi:hypothetical protein
MASGGKGGGKGLVVLGLGLCGVFACATNPSPAPGAPAPSAVPSASDSRPTVPNGTDACPYGADRSTCDCPGDETQFKMGTYTVCGPDDLRNYAHCVMIVEPALSFVGEGDNVEGSFTVGLSKAFGVTGEGKKQHAVQTIYNAVTQRTNILACAARFLGEAAAAVAATAATASATTAAPAAPPSKPTGSQGVLQGGTLEEGPVVDVLKLRCQAACKYLHENACPTAKCEAAMIKALEKVKGTKP